MSRTVSRNGSTHTLYSHIGGKMALTDSFIKKNTAEAPLAKKSYPDGEGLALYHFPNGSKIWHYRYRYLGKAKMIAIDDEISSYPEVSLKEARIKHEKLRSLLHHGIDPSMDRQERALNKLAEQDNSFKSIATLWFKSWKTNKTDQHQKAVWNRLENDLFPHLGKLPIADITAQKILMVIKKIEARGALDIAKRTFQTTGQIYRYAVAHGFCERNPARDIKPSDALKPRESKNFARVDAKELPELLRKIDGYQEQGGSVITLLALQLMSYTFLRTVELIKGEWAEIDWDNKQWRIPASRMKMKTEHIVPLSTQAIEVLKKLRQISGGRKLIFPSESSPLKSMSNNTILFALYRLGYHSRMTGHGFRGIASTILHEQGYPHEHIELQLAHQERNKVSASYNYATYLVQRAKMLQDWANYLDAIKSKSNISHLKAVNE